MKLLVDISAHGLGHLTQTAAVLIELDLRLPTIEVVVRSGLAPERIAAALPRIKAHVPADDGFGVVMKSALEVDREATFRAYLRLHEELDDRIEELTAWIGTEQFDGVLSNVSYPVLAAARAAGVPAVAMSSLNWRDVFATYAAPTAACDDILGRIGQCYAAAHSFLRLEPGMPMRNMKTTAVKGLLAASGCSDRDRLVRALGGEARRPLILLAFGGMLPEEPPPFLTERPLGAVIGQAVWARQGLCHAADSIGMAFVDLVASCDLVVTKPGYGIVAELGLAGTPALLVSRGDWPEERPLVDWLKRHGRAAVVPNIGQLSAGQIERHLLELAAQPRGRRPELGAGELVAHLLRAMA